MSRAVERGYLWAVAVAGTALVVHTVVRHFDVLAIPVVWLLLAFLVALEVIVTRATRTREQTDFGAGTMLAIACLLGAGGAAAVIVFAWGSLVHALVRAREAGGVLRHARANGVRILFNVGQAALSMLAPAAVVSALTGRPLLAVPPDGNVVTDLPTVVLAAAAFLAVNLLFVATAIALLQRSRFSRAVSAFVTHQGPVMAAMLAGAPVVAVVFAHAPQLSPLLAVLLLAMHQSARAFHEKHQQALHDPLTGLPNRMLFNTRVDEALESARVRRARVGMLIVDLDGFKAVNDTLGHHAGDRALSVVGQRLAGAVRDTDMVARLGGDEFGVVLCEIDTTADASTAAQKVRAALEHPVAIDGQQVTIRASVGVAVRPDHGEDADTLFRHADARMYDDKRSSRSAPTPRGSALGDRTATERPPSPGQREALDRRRAPGDREALDGLGAPDERVAIEEGAPLGG